MSTRRRMKVQRITGEEAITRCESPILSRMVVMLFRASLAGVTSPPSGSPGTPKSLYLSLSLSLSHVCLHEIVIEMCFIVLCLVA